MCLPFAPLFGQINTIWNLEYSSDCQFFLFLLENCEFHQQQQNRKRKGEMVLFRFCVFHSIQTNCIWGFSYILCVLEANKNGKRMEKRKRINKNMIQNEISSFVTTYKKNRVSTHFDFQSFPSLSIYVTSAPSKNFIFFPFYKKSSSNFQSETPALHHSNFCTFGSELPWAERWRVLLARYHI